MEEGGEEGKERGGVSKKKKKKKIVTHLKIVPNLNNIWREGENLFTAKRCFNLAFNRF